MGGEPFTTLIRFPDRQALPSGYEVVHDGHLYWWQMASDRGQYGGGDVDRWQVWRDAWRHAKSTT